MSTSGNPKPGVNACDKFSSQFNDQVAAGEFGLDFITKRALEERPLTPQAKADMGLPGDAKVTMYHILKPALDVLPKMRLIYVSTMLEAFFQEYVGEREGVSWDTVKSLDPVKQAMKRWRGTGSTSFYNLKFVEFLIGDLYGIRFPDKVSPVTREIGEVRRAIVHYQGRIPSEFVLGEVRCTLDFLGLAPAVGTEIRVEKKLITTYINDMRTIFRECKICASQD